MDTILCQGVDARYAMIDQIRPLFRVAMLCGVLGVSKSGYYARQYRKPSVLD